MAETNQGGKPPKGIWGKLFQIQKEVRTFDLTADSDKEDPKTKKSAYRYTPGWKITETVRDIMDRLGLMLVPDFSMERSETIEYPVYKMLGENP